MNEFQRGKLPQTREQAILQLRVILAAMIMGIVSFGGVSLYLIVNGRQPDASWTLTFVAVTVFVAVALLITFRFLKTSLLKPTLHPTQPGLPPSPESVGVFYTLTLIAGAMIEGVGLLGTIGFFLSGDYLTLLAPLGAIALLANLMKLEVFRI